MSNTVTVVGNLTRDPELRYTPSGQAVVKFGIAVNRSYTAVRLGPCHAGQGYPE
jgi:single stranded DNA-binding protein